MAFNPGRHSTLAETLFPQSSEYFFLLSSFLHSLTPQSPVLVWGAASLSPAGLTCHISSLHYPLCPARRRGDRRGGGRAWSGSLPDLAPQGKGLALNFRGVRGHLAEGEASNAADRVRSAPVGPVRSWPARICSTWQGKGGNRKFVGDRPRGRGHPTPVPVGGATPSRSASG